MYSQEEILKALRIIQGVCGEQESCETCPLRIFDEDCYGSYGCTLNRYDNPTEWKLKTREEIWRAFEN